MLKYLLITLVILYYLFTNSFIFGQDYTLLHPDIKYVQDANSLYKIYIIIPDKKSSAFDKQLNYLPENNSTLKIELISDSCLLITTDSAGFRNFPDIYDTWIANLKGGDYYYELLEQEKKSRNYNQKLYKSFIHTYSIDSLFDYQFKNSRPGNNSLILEIFHQETHHKKRVFKRKNLILKYYNREYIFELESKGFIEPFQWTIKEKKEEFSISTTDKNYTIVLATSNMACDCCDEYALRIFENDKYLWQNEFEIICKTEVIIYDFQNDGNDEIILFNNNHGIISINIIEKQ